MKLNHSIQFVIGERECGRGHRHGWVGEGGEESRSSDAFGAARTSKTSGAKRTAQGQCKCRGQGRMERERHVFVKMHKEHLEKSPRIGRPLDFWADLPIIQAILMQFTIIPHKSSLVKYFRKIYPGKFSTKKIWLKLTKTDTVPKAPHAAPRGRGYPAKKTRIHRLFSRNPHRKCLQIHKYMLYY